MALFFCGISCVSNFKSYSRILFLFFMLKVISSASIVPSLSDYNMTKQRIQRRSDAWIAHTLDSICPWAECQGWIGCTRLSNQPTTCTPTPRNFRELQPYEVKPMSRRRSLGTCYGYSPPDKRAPNDWCKDGPRLDECACINSDHILPIYSEPGETHPQDDAPIGDLCASRITSPCTTTAVGLPVTPGEHVTSFVISNNVATDPVASSPTTPRLVSSTTTYVSPTTEGSTYLNHWYIWPALVVVVALVSCLLVALYRRRSNFRTTSAGGNCSVELDENGYLAVSRLVGKVSTTLDNYNAQSDKSVAACEEPRTNDGGSAKLLPYEELKIIDGEYAELRPYEELKVSKERSAELRPYEEPKISDEGSAEDRLYEEPKISDGGSAEDLLYEEPKSSDGGSAEHRLYEEPKSSNGGSSKHHLLKHPLCEPIRSYDHAEPYAQV